MGVWIEIGRKVTSRADKPMSLPLWECGLKSIYLDGKKITEAVTPFMGVWIEIY